MKIKEYLLLPILVIFIAWSQFILLRPHLEYGFNDVDWGFLSIYKTQNPYTIHQFIKNIEAGGTRGGVYTHQIYYIGIQNDLFGLDFKSFQITTHIFKVLAILATFPLFLAISGSSTVAFIATVLFGFSYSAVGTMYTVVTSSDYSAVFALGIFILIYWHAVRKNSSNLFILILCLLLLILTLFLSTERMYPLPLYIALTEGFLIFQKRKLEKNTIMRILVILLPPFLIFLAMPAVFLSFVSNHGLEIVQRVLAGNWNLLLTPFIVLGSIVIPHDYTKYFGLVKMDSFLSFLDFFITGPLFVLVTVTIAIGVLIFKKPQIIIIQILGLMGFFSVILYILGSHFIDHQISLESIVQALIGLYILAIAIVGLLYWRRYKDRLLLGLFVGPFLAFLYIFLTWVGAATSEIFSGIHRYLTIPALFMSLFLGNLITLMMLRIFTLLKRFKILRFLALSPLILLILFVNVNSKEIQTFFTSQLTNGFGALDKQMMRNQLLSYLDNLSTDKPSLIYFDFTQDNDNGYYYDNTLLGGFGSWILWHKNINFNEKNVPITFWNNPQLLKTLYLKKDGKKGFFFNKAFFEIKDFYAFKLKDKNVIDIKKELLNELGSY